LQRIDEKPTQTIFTSTLTLLLTAIVADMKSLQVSYDKTAKCLATMTGYAKCGDLVNWYLERFKSDIRHE
jgi:hypothetical protein